MYRVQLSISPKALKFFMTLTCCIPFYYSLFFSKAHIHTRTATTCIWPFTCYASSANALGRNVANFSNSNALTIFRSIPFNGFVLCWTLCGWKMRTCLQRNFYRLICL